MLLAPLIARTAIFDEFRQSLQVLEDSVLEPCTGTQTVKMCSTI